MYKTYRKEKRLLIRLISRIFTANIIMKENKKTFEFVFGAILFVVGLFMLFKSARVYSFGFWHWGPIDTGAICIVLLILAVIALVVRPNKVTKILTGFAFAFLALSIILGMKIGFVSMSVVDVVLIILPLAIGIGLILKALLGGREKKLNKEKKEN